MQKRRFHFRHPYETPPFCSFACHFSGVCLSAGPAYVRIGGNIAAFKIQNFKIPPLAPSCAADGGFFERAEKIYFFCSLFLATQHYILYALSRYALSCMLYLVKVKYV